MSEQPQDNISTALKVPPQSIEAERSVLGGLMLDDQSWFDLVELIKPSDFYRTQHQIIFEAMMVIENLKDLYMKMLLQSLKKNILKYLLLK